MRLHRAISYSPEKIQAQVTEGVEDIDLLGILKKEHVEIPGVN